MGGGGDDRRRKGAKGNSRCSAFGFAGDGQEESPRFDEAVLCQARGAVATDDCKEVRKSIDEVERENDRNIVSYVKMMNPNHPTSRLLRTLPPAAGGAPPPPRTRKRSTQGGRRPPPLLQSCCAAAADEVQ